MRSGRKQLDSGQLRSRKSTMVPRVNQMSHHSSQAVELKEIGDHHVSPWETGLDLGTSFTVSQSMINTFRETGITENGNVMHGLDSERTSHESVEGSSYGVGEDDEDDFKDDEERQLLPSEQRSEHQDVVVENEPRDQEVMVREAEEKESSLGIMLQILVPYLIAGFGMVGAGMVLDVVQHSEVFTNITELFILVPALLGLKGNLEMTLASRLSTQANLGNMDTRKEKIKMVCGNLVLVQAQATVVGFLASMFAMVMGWIPKGQFPLDHALLLCASSLFTAAVASFILGSLMVCVVMLSRKVNINPDNVATPIAASLGDLTTLALLAGVGKLLYSFVGKQIWLSCGIIALFFMLLPIWIVLAVKNKYTNDVIYSGWTPVLSAMVISSLGGVILDFAVSSYHGIAVFQPVINGVGGNLVAVQASRISTYLHRRGRPGKLPTGVPGGSFNPFAFFCGKSINSKAARVLLLLVIPGHLLFIYTIYYMKAGHTSITILFNLFYLLAALLQVLLLLYICQWMVHCIWSCGEDPDNVAIPYLTAIGDLLGTGFLALAFHLLYLVGDRDADLGE